MQRSGSKMSKLFRWSVAVRDTEVRGRYFDFVSCFHLVTLSMGAITGESDAIAPTPSSRSWFSIRAAARSDADSHLEISREQEAT